MRRRFFLVLPLVLVTAGCAVRGPSTWRLAGPTLTPPGVPNDALAQRTFTLNRSGARGPCPTADAVAIVARKDRLKITVNRPALEKQPRGWLADWAASAETGRCVAPGQAEVLAAMVLESLPLASATRLRLMRSDDVRAGYTDLGSESGLEVISPIVKPGTDPNAPVLEAGNTTGSGNSITVELKTSPNLLGHETALYRFEPKQGGGTRMVVISAQSSIQGRVESLPAPARNYFTFTPDAAFYRLFYESDMRAVVVGAPSRDRLPKDLSGCSATSGLQCIALPPLVGVNTRQFVSVNGRPMVVGPGATVRSVIQAARRRPEDVLPTLAVTKSYAGKPAPLVFDRSKQDILGLALTGNEELRW